jgi:hypothetical protein
VMHIQRPPAALFSVMHVAGITPRQRTPTDVGQRSFDATKVHHRPTLPAIERHMHQ